ncbi:hypothetical protein IAQ61_008657 [Plenodomus lingam]|uniref:uncharacterized protein n=1 Tax=Leptosphaeria maculans TaxID=5022 RepID=UPI0033263350|nr:hypothetical protein IAQ61_008657 [Plenodomus lingam]
MINVHWISSQLKVVSSDMDMNTRESLYKGISVDNHEGIAASHPRWPEIIAIVYHHRNNPNNPVRKQYQQRLKYSDYLYLVLDEEKKVLDISTLRTQDIEDRKVPQSDEHVAAIESQTWTSHHNILPAGCLDALISLYRDSGEEENLPDVPTAPIARGGDRHFPLDINAVLKAPTSIGFSTVAGKKRRASESFMDDSTTKRVRETNYNFS